MSLRIWLKKSAKAGDDGKIANLKVESDEKSGGKYLTVYHIDPIDPAMRMPSVRSKDVTAITYTDEYYVGFKPDGLYRTPRASARVKTVKYLHTPGWDNKEDCSIMKISQHISITAPSLKALREIYSQIRTGELKATEVWGLVEEQML